MNSVFVFWVITPAQSIGIEVGPSAPILQLKIKLGKLCHPAHLECTQL